MNARYVRTHSTDASQDLYTAASGCLVSRPGSHSAGSSALPPARKPTVCTSCPRAATTRNKDADASNLSSLHSLEMPEEDRRWIRCWPQSLFARRDRAVKRDASRPHIYAGAARGWLPVGPLPVRAAPASPLDLTRSVLNVLRERVQLDQTLRASPACISNARESIKKRVTATRRVSQAVAGEADGKARTGCGRSLGEGDHACTPGQAHETSLFWGSGRKKKQGKTGKGLADSATRYAELEEPERHMGAWSHPGLGPGGKRKKEGKF